MFLRRMKDGEFVLWALEWEGLLPPKHAWDVSVNVKGEATKRLSIMSVI